MMKRIVFTLLLLVIASSCFAQYSPDKKKLIGKPNAFKINPLGVFALSVWGSYERAVAEKTSFVFHLGYGGIPQIVTFLNGGIDLRFYTNKSKELLDGFYVSPGVGIFTVNAIADNSEPVNFGYLRFLVGNQWIFKKGLTVDLFGGLGVFGDLSGEDSFVFPLPVVGFALGGNF